MTIPVLNRINELAHIAKTRALTAEETAERDHILQQYRAAAERRDFAAQEQLISRHGKFFSAKDRLWLRHAKLADELRRARADGDRKRLEQVYDGLSKILRESEENSEIYSQAKRDRMAVLIALGRDQEALEDYRALARHQEQPDYVKEQYAQALAMNSRPVTASAQPPSVTKSPSKRPTPTMRSTLRRRSARRPRQSLTPPIRTRSHHNRNRTTKARSPSRARRKWAKP